MATDFVKMLSTNGFNFFNNELNTKCQNDFRMKFLKYFEALKYSLTLEVFENQIVVSGYLVNIMKLFLFPNTFVINI